MIRGEGGSCGLAGLPENLTAGSEVYALGGVYGTLHVEAGDGSAGENAYLLVLCQGGLDGVVVEVGGKTDLTALGRGNRAVCLVAADESAKRREGEDKKLFHYTVIT
jgi:preprotein translocase subunit YajC